MTRESVLEADLDKRVSRGFGGMTFKLAPTTVGLPDRLVVLPGGRMYLVEMKAETGRLSAAQSALHRRLARIGIRVHVVTGRMGVINWIRDRGQEITPNNRRQMPGSWSAANLLDSKTHHDLVRLSERIQEKEAELATRILAQLEAVQVPRTDDL